MTDYFQSNPFTLPKTTDITGKSITQNLLILAIAFFAVAIMVNSLNLGLGIDRMTLATNGGTTAELQRALQRKFIGLVVFSVIIFIMGLILLFLITNKERGRVLFLSLMLAGVIALVYALWTRYLSSQVTGVTLLVLCIIAFIIVVILAFITTRNKGVIPYSLRSPIQGYTSDTLTLQIQFLMLPIESVMVLN